MPSVSAIAPGVRPSGPACTSMRKTANRVSWASAARALTVWVGVMGKSNHFNNR